MHPLLTGRFGTIIIILLIVAVSAVSQQLTPISGKISLQGRVASGPSIRDLAVDSVASGSVYLNWRMLDDGYRRDPSSHAVPDLLSAFSEYDSVVVHTRTVSGGWKRAVVIRDAPGYLFSVSAVGVDSVRCVAHGHADGKYVHGGYLPPREFTVESRTVSIR